jgi:AraC family transcriptional regulator
MANSQDKFVKIINHIESNLDKKFNIDELCQLAYLSKYHFHRQCSAFFNMPVMAIVKLLRLKRTAYQLAYRDEKIIDIALMNGYESHQAFSRAFKQQFNQSPSSFRRSPDWAFWHSQYEPILKLRTKIKIMNDDANLNTSLNVDIIDFPETIIAVIEHRAAPKFIGKTIQKFIQWRKANKLAPNKSKTFNLVYDDPNITEPENYRFDVCCSIKHTIEENSYGVINKVIPAGKCAVIRHVGSDDSIGVAVRYLYEVWLNNTDVEIRDFPLFFERVSFFPEVPENEMVTDIYLPIK